MDAANRRSSSSASTRGRASQAGASSRIDQGTPRVVGCDVIAPKARLPIEQRLEHIFSELGDVIAHHLPTVMAIEEPFVGANVRSAMAVGEARTVAMLAATLAGVQVCHYAPARIKQSVAGYGHGRQGAGARDAAPAARRRRAAGRPQRDAMRWPWPSATPCQHRPRTSSSPRRR